MKTHNILSIDEFKTNIGSNSRLLGIDPGNKNIGIAICDENHMVATPLTSIINASLKSREDEVKDEKIRNQILKNSPEKNKEFFVVPKVLD